MRSLSLSLTFVSLGLALACAEQPAEPSRSALVPKDSPSRSLDIQTEYLCGASISPASQTVVAGDNAYINTTLPVCSRSTGALIRYDHTSGYWLASDGGYVLDQYNRDAGHNATDQAHLTRSTAGGVTLTVRPCCDYDFNRPTLTSTVTFTPPLTATISGPSYVGHGDTCSWSASASGGTPPYSYYWTANWYSPNTTYQFSSGQSTANASAFGYYYSSYPYTTTIDVNLYVSDAGGHSRNVQRSTTLGNSYGATGCS